MAGIACYSRNITERIKAEKVTLDLVYNLKNRNLQQFSYIVSHNLRAQVAKISGLTFLNRIVPEHQINGMTLIECVEQEINNLDNVVKDMNTIISYRDLESKHSGSVHFETGLKALIGVFETQIEESGVEISSDFSQAESIQSVKSYIYSIMYNLISNAIKYRREDLPLKVQIKTKNIEDFIVLEVIDNGMGIDLLKHGNELFGLYKRFHNKNIDGRGIGLILVKAQAESLGGRVEVESFVGMGTIFNVFLPLNIIQDAINE